MDCHVKVFLSFSVVMIALFSSTITMECPRLIPRQEPKSINPRVAVVKAISDAVFGPSHARELTIYDLPPEAEYASPADLYKMCRTRLEDCWLEDIKKHGISLQDLEKQFADVDEFLKIRRKQRILATVPAGSPLKRIMRSVSNAMNVPDMEIRVHHKKSIAACVGGSFIVCNPAELNDEAPTPRKVRHILGHERRHALNQDTRFRLAYKRALIAAGKNPDKYKRNMHVVQRIGEVFSDLETAALGQDWANAYAEITARSQSRKEDYKPTSHPTRAARRDLGELNKLFCEVWNNESQRQPGLRRSIDADDQSVTQPRKVARVLFEEK